MGEGRKKIIIVDDNITNLDIGRSILSEFYQVIPAPSAEKMLMILERIIPDLILLDIEMPDMNGYEAIKRLKADPRFSAIPVIFLTAKRDAANEREGMRLGAADYIIKPFVPADLRKSIEENLAR